MKLSLNWLSDYIEIPSKITPDQLAYDLTMTTVEVESVEDLGASFDKMVVGQISKIEAHPDADKLKVVKTDVGESALANIVCGGSNLTEGMFVAVAQNGSQVRWHGEGDLITLKPAKIRGVASEGMICASNEIGLADLFPSDDEKEILDLADVHAESPLVAGTPLADALGLNDVILDIDNKSLTNRPDLWGHYGIARELAAIYSLELKEAYTPLELPSKDAKLVSVSIENTQRSPRYCGATLNTNNEVMTPFWMKRRLSLMSQRPINFLVDLTNYVLFAIGKPIHVFDADKLSGTSITVRNAKRGERVLLLDESEYELTEEDLVIADEAGPVALAGIMGGLESSVTESTTKVLLESANFEAIGTRRTGSRFGIRTESSMRFEKGLDSAKAEEGIHLYLSLLKDFQKNTEVTSFDDCYPVKPAEITVSTSKSFINSRTGQDLTAIEIKNYLERLCYQVSEDPNDQDMFHIIVPAWRSTGDVSIPEDIVEEVARLHGYDNLEFIPPPVILEEAVFQPEYDLRMKMRTYLSTSGGMNEVVTYPWVEDQYLEASGYDPSACVVLHAPPSPSSKHLRPSLVPNLLFGVKQNRRNFSEFSLFEVAMAFTPSEEKSSGDKEVLPVQTKFLSGVTVRDTAQNALFSAKGILEGLFSTLPFGTVKFSLSESQTPWGQNGSVLNVMVPQSDIPVGVVALLSQSVAMELSIKHCEVGVFELNLDLLNSLTKEKAKYTPLPQYPQVDYELSLLIDKDIPWEKIEHTVQSSSALMRQVEFLDVYEGKQVPEGKKSLSLRFTLGDKEATLSSDQVNQVAERVLKKLGKSYGAELRAG